MMYKSQTMIILLAFYVLPAMATRDEVNSPIKNKTEGTRLKFVLEKLDTSKKALELSYQINNDSEQDVWLCKDFGSGYRSFEIAMIENTETLLVRRRLNVPITGFGEQVFGSYIRIPRKTRLKETILLPLPIHPNRISMSPKPTERVIKHVKRILIEIGFYSGDLPGAICNLFKEADNDPQERHVDEVGYPTDVIGWLVSPLIHNGLNESVPDRNEQIIIPWTDSALKGEHVLRATIENLHVPFIENTTLRTFRLESLSLCTKVEITYRPSMLEYLFPYPIQRDVLNSDEKKYLQSQGRIRVNDRSSIDQLVHEIGKGAGWGSHGGYIFTDLSTTANVVCYQGDKQLTSFTIYDDKAIVTEDKQCHRYIKDLASIEILTSHVQGVMPFRFRVECAANLGKLWHRLRLYSKAERTRIENPSNENQIVYPAIDKWCDVMVRAFKIAGSEEYLLKAHKCPSANDGRNHYALNPHCEQNSPPDMVLLFETKAGWNQHGGPELFAFDNHDPKGGCVLLNDSTVKFIRTKEELQQLRWK